MAEKEKNKDALLQDTLKQIEKQYGKGSIMKLGDRANVDIDATQQRFDCDRLCAGHRRLSERPDYRDLRTGIFW